MYFLLKRFPNISVTDFHPDRILSHEMIVGLKQLELWFIERQDKEEGKAERKAGRKSKF